MLRVAETPIFWYDQAVLVAKMLDLVPIGGPQAGEAMHHDQRLRSSRVNVDVGELKLSWCLNVANPFNRIASDKFLLVVPRVEIICS